MQSYNGAYLSGAGQPPLARHDMVYRHVVSNSLRSQGLFAARGSATVTRMITRVSVEAQVNQSPVSERLGAEAGPDSRPLRGVLRPRARTTRDEREMYSIRTPQLAKDRRQSRLDRSLPDIELSRYFLVGGALGHHTGNLALSGRQHGEAAPFRGRPGPPDDQSKLGNETGQHLSSRPNLTAVDLLDRLSEELGSDSCAAVPARSGLENRHCLPLGGSVGKDKDCRAGARFLDPPHISCTPKLRERKVEEKDIGLECAHCAGQRIAVGFLMDDAHVLERPAPPRSDRGLGAHEQNSRTTSTTSPRVGNVIERLNEEFHRSNRLASECELAVPVRGCVRHRDSVPTATGGPGGGTRHRRLQRWPRGSAPPAG
jgi:hypothetical protein